MKKLLAVCILLLSFHSSYSQSREKFDSLFSVLSASKQDTTRVNTLTELALEYRYVNSDTAMDFARQALELATKLDYEMGIADAKLRVGMVCANTGKYNEGVKSCDEALVLYNKLILYATAANKDAILKKIGRTYNVIGHNRLAQGNYTESLKYSFLALKIREEQGDLKGIHDTEANISNIYFFQKDFTESRKHIAIALEIALKMGNKPEISNAYMAIGSLYSIEENYPEALKNYTLALKIAEESANDDVAANIYLNMGDVNERLGLYINALNYYSRAINTFRKTGDKENITLTYMSFGSVYTKQKKYNEAFENLDMALALAKEIGSLEYIKLSYEHLAILNNARGNYKQALEDYKLFVTYRDSLINKESTKKIVQQQMQYDFDKKESLTRVEQEKKDAITEKNLQRQKLVRNGFVSGFTVVLFFAGVFFSQRNKIKKGKKRSDDLLLNILPEEVAEELKATGSAAAKQFAEVTVMFTDFKNFTQVSEKLSPSELVAEIDYYFKAFDSIISSHNIEKIKTIGDSYMCAGGLPVDNKTHAEDVVSAAIEIQNFVTQHLLDSKKENKLPLEVRIGIHTGPVVAGIVGVKKFAYDIWGDTVNIASRMESSGEAGKINISEFTHEKLNDKFTCIYRGKIKAKNKGEIDMYFVTG